MDTRLIINAIKLHYGFKTDTAFAKYLGITQGAIAAWYMRNTIDYKLITTKCSDIDANWLLTGEGEMLKKGAKLNKLNNIVDSIQNGATKSYNIPLYDLTASAGVFSGNQSMEHSNPVGSINIKNGAKFDGAIYIKGESMQPVLQSGEIVVFKMLNSMDNIVYGEMYVAYIEHKGHELFIIKYINQSEKEGYLQFSSHNPNYAPVEFPISSIKQVAIAKRHFN